MQKEWNLLERLEGHDRSMDLLSGTFWIGAAIGAGASLIGGLIGQSSKKKQEERNIRDQRNTDAANHRRVVEMNADVRRRAEAAAAVPIVTSGWERIASSVDVEGMMAAAEKAGFNPVTWLRNGGLAAYARTSRDYSESVTGSRAMEAALAGSEIYQQGQAYQRTAPTQGEVFGNALAQFGSGVSEFLTQQQQNAFQMQLLNAQLQGNNRASAQRAYQQQRSGGNSPGAVRSLTSMPVSQLVGSLVSNAGSGALSEKKAPIPDLWVPMRDNSVSGGGRVVWVANPDVADSEQLTAALAASVGGTIQAPYNQQGPRQPTIDNRVKVQLINPVITQPGGGATLGDVAGYLSSIYRNYLQPQPKSIWGDTSW